MSLRARAGLAAFALLLAGAGCTREQSFMPTVRDSIPATVTMVEHDVNLMAARKEGQPCFALTIGGLSRGDRTDISEYTCMDSRDQLVTSLLIKDGSQLAVGGAVVPPVATVTVNGQPTPRDGHFFLTVLPTIPDNGVNVVASDRDGRVLSSEEHPRLSSRARGSRARRHRPRGREVMAMRKPSAGLRG